MTREDLLTEVFGGFWYLGSLVNTFLPLDVLRRSLYSWKILVVGEKRRAYSHADITVGEAFVEVVDSQEE